MLANIANKGFPSTKESRANPFFTHAFSSYKDQVYKDQALNLP